MKIDSITMKLLKTFKTVAMHKNHTRAASKLNITQPAVTKQIRQLEDVLGLQLFFYKSRQLYLTDAASSLLPKIEEILLSVENLSHVIHKHIDEPIQGNIKLGVVYAAQDKVFDMLEIFHNSFKKIKVDLIFSDYSDIVKKLMSQEIDFAFAGTLTEDLPVDYVKYDSYGLYMIAPKSYGDLSSKVFDISELVNEKKILNEKGSFSRVVMENLFSEDELANSFEINNNYTIVNAVANGFGIALVSEIIITEKVKRKIQVLNVKQLPVTSALSLINLKGRKLSKTEEIFKDHVKKNSLISLRR